ncbi:Negative elongation factor C/D [Rhizophlyctis rosea]|uniref:Negative elongation factor C/D n=1 Tax=Rhizophlyctis rosea TaxID=64517 RepID=A0AAD5SEB9_9FUNG|nr:Negative elongation factor C/D [Rhizophlyctis rosea]
MDMDMDMDMDIDDAVPVPKQPDVQNSKPSIPTVYNNFKTWNTAIVAKLQKLDGVRDEDIKQWVVDNLRPIGCLDTYNYFHTQYLIAGLYRQTGKNSNWAKNLRRVSQELMELTIDKQDAQSLNEVIRYDESIAPNILRSLTEIINSRKATVGDITKLHTYFTTDAVGQKKLHLLRDYSVLEPILVGAFSRTRSREGMAVRLQLIALASAGGSKDAEANVKLTEDALKELEATTGKVLSATQFSQNVPEFLRAIELPVTALGYIFWLRENVLQPGDQFYDWKLYHQNKAPLMFDLLDEIAVRYPSHRSYIAEIWYSLLRRDFSIYTPVLAIEFKEYLLDRLLFLLKTGYVMPVLRVMAANAVHVDEKLMTHFVSNVLFEVETPFTRELILPVARMLEPLQPTAFKHCRTDKQAAVVQFLDAANSPLNDFRYNPEESNLLRSLVERFK